MVTWWSSPDIETMAGELDFTRHIFGYHYIVAIDTMDFQYMKKHIAFAHYVMLIWNMKQFHLLLQF